jgi:hypothetical protein
MMPDLDRAKREELRWLILLTLYQAQEIGLSENIILNSVQPCMPDVTQTEIRRGMDYLVERDLITIEDRRRQVWFAKINRVGIDIVEYTIDCHPGIARPRKW